MAGAELVGSLHLHPNDDVADVISTNSLRTRTASGTADANTRGTVEGSFSFLAGGTSANYSGTLPQINSFGSATFLKDMDRYGGTAKKGIAVWDYDLSGIASNAWELKVDFSDRHTTDADEWYISINGLGRTLDTRDLSTLVPATGHTVLLDATKYIKIGELPAGSDAAAVYQWDLTEIITAAQENDGKVRLVYAAAGFRDDIRFLNDSGIIGADSTSGAAVTYPLVTTLLEDDFNSGSGTKSGSGIIANGWESVGPEEKVYNTVSSLGTNFTGKLGWTETGAGSFDTVAAAFSSYTLTEIGDYITVSFDYLTTSTVNNGTGVRVRLYESGSNLSNGGSGYGLNIPSGTSTSAISYRSYTNGNPYATLDGAGTAVAGGPSYGDGGSVVLAVTKTGVDEITLSGSHGTNVFAFSVPGASLYTFDAFGVSVGSLTQGLEIDNVQIQSSLIPPFVFVSDDFESGTASSSNSILANGWFASAGGLEFKEYNVSSSGVLDIRDASIEAEFDSAYIKFQDLPLTNNGDWLELSVDMQWYEDTSGAAFADTSDPLANLTLVDSSKTNNAGYGFRIKSGKFHQLTIHDGPTAFPTQVPGSETSREQAATNGTFQTWTLRIERSGSDFLLSPAIDNKLFGPSGSEVETFTNNAAIDAVFDQLTFTVRGNNIGMKIDNVEITSNVEALTFTAFESWALSYGLSGADAGESANPDADALDNYSEYVFGGHPDDNTDIGHQPVLDVESGDYVYVLRNDDALSASVLTRDDLITGDWTTNAPMDVTANDGGLTAYTNAVGTLELQQFIKLLVE
jgi:hypothetical protein